MATYAQLPGILNLVLTRGEDFIVEADFSISLSGYTFTSTLNSLVDNAQILSMTTSVVNPANGVVNVSLTRSQTQSLAAGTYSWRMIGDSGAVHRVYLAGFVEVLP
jgi:hypothetical protein